MPIYRLKCDSCESTQEIFRAIKDMNIDLPKCCGAEMHRVIVAPMVAADIAPYQSMITGEMITSRSQHRAHLKAHGCVEVGNEAKHLKSPEVKPPPGLKEKIIHAANKHLK